MSGAAFADVQVTTTGAYAGQRHGPLWWLHLHGIAGVDDLRLGPRLSLRASPRALAVLREHHIEHTVVLPD